eukprot:TRINITY_DN7412_c0_g1_i4.p1 TRINITY_DN7412_c0_g1~~TRINITY_DN7412_c0_g1_i4.p1  ORF type:complete len:281 (+),score=44.18 TRINITY_DN7412_c0_g1_i4:42-845(+)
MGAGNSSRSGYRVLAVHPNSPFSELPVEPLLDYMVIPEGNDCFSNAKNFAALVAKSEGKEFPLNLYNLADQELRQSTIVPRKWEGRGLLGADFVLEQFNEDFSPALRVLNIYATSPLDKAGVKPYTDYILGTKRQTFQSISDFDSFIKCSHKTPIVLQIYSSQAETVREAIVIPDKDWGGVGMLGGDITFGALNAIPLRKSKPRPASPKDLPKFPSPASEHIPNSSKETEGPMLCLSAIDRVCELSLIHICRCRRYAVCRSRWSPYH